MPAKKGQKTPQTTLKAWRNHFRLTQREVANMLGVTHSAVAKWESGATPLDLETFRQVAEAFGIDPASLLLDPGAEARASQIKAAHHILENASAEAIDAWIRVGLQLAGLNEKQQGGDAVPSEINTHDEFQTARGIKRRARPSISVGESAGSVAKVAKRRKR